MRAYFYKGIPKYQLSQFQAVRDGSSIVENLANIAEIVNTCHHCMCNEGDYDCDMIIFSGGYQRVLVRKSDGYFSMGLPFHIIDDGGVIHFNIESIAEPVSGRVVSILRNASLTWRQFRNPDDVVLSLCDSFGIDTSEAIDLCNAFLCVLAEDHGYFRFDDDPKNEDGHVHPRYHYDFFFKNSTSVKIGCDQPGDLNCFYALCDPALPKRYLRKYEG